MRGVFREAFGQVLETSTGKKGFQPHVRHQVMSIGVLRSDQFGEFPGAKDARGHGPRGCGALEDDLPSHEDPVPKGTDRARLGFSLDDTLSRRPLCGEIDAGDGRDRSGLLDLQAEGESEFQELFMKNQKPLFSASP